ncbi:hypothetical protein [Sphingomonas nostoxanthinifaciens]|uniref:hypothetical protein n=1 Tax=Sphingomonas nostoxanthinifaciens TaxID=2872652 RepID=UPI001CC2017F|nr:hypothetical protein [Sphingomonas nostoxanthinifaciens]UAK25945.1 hypothetical protein K8P63_07445 [Sphingomonas nostoxanthinifaciens]
MSDHNPNDGPFDTGGKAVAEEGIVLLDGPDGIAISLTPDAAEETGSSLIEAARAARDQATPDR